VPRATFGENTSTYDYDFNGNQTHRLVHSIVNGQPVTQEFEIEYDAENRVKNVTGVEGTTYSANFTYDGNGQRVKSTINGETTLFVNGIYELNTTTSQVTKYYPGGAIRKYTIPQSMNVEYVLGDHLGSATVMTDSNGSKVSEMRYSPWGEVRYSWVDSTLSTTPAYTLPKHTFTGQYSYMDDPSTQGVDGFGLMFYNARFYDPQVGRFAQADTIVPGGVQGLDRYSYVNNSPVNYIDPSGHRAQDPYWCANARNPGQCRQNYYVSMKMKQDHIEALLNAAVYIAFLVPIPGCTEPVTLGDTGCRQGGGDGMGTVVGNMSTIVTAQHLLTWTITYVGTPTVLAIKNKDGKVEYVPVSDLTFTSGLGDRLTITLKNPLPDGFVAPAKSMPQKLKVGQMVDIVYMDANQEFQVFTTIIVGIKNDQYYYDNPSFPQSGNKNGLLLYKGDSGGGIFVNGQFVGINVDASNFQFIPLGYFLSYPPQIVPPFPLSYI
jgi:RHS repeat-associated protein